MAHFLTASDMELVFRRGDVNLAAVTAGCIVWKTDDPALRRRLERTFAQDRPARRVPLKAVVRGSIGGALRLTLGDDEGHEAEVAWEGPLERALKHPPSLEVIREQLGRLGETPFELAEVTVDLPEPVMVPKSILNDLRRRAVARLLDQRCRETGERRIHPEALGQLRREIAGRRGAADGRQALPPGHPHWYVLVRTLEQLDAVLAWQLPAPLVRPALVYCDFEDVRRYGDAVGRARAAGVPIGLATLRIVKPHEEGLLRQIASYGPDVLLVRNLAGLTYYREHAPRVPLVGDFSFNVANELTADLLAGEGLVRMVPGYDLNWEQLTAMLGQVDAGLFEVVIHQHIPMFHMEHCVFAAFLSGGKDWRDCGRPCDRHRIELRDRVGAAFPVVADTGCRNTIYNSVPQSAAEYVGRMKALGLRHFRVEVLREGATEVGPLLERYARVLAGLDDGQDTWRQLRVLNQLGVTRGTLQLI